jgi:hypothetical protein
MASQVNYYFYDSNSMRVCGVGSIDPNIFAVHQAALQNSKQGYNLIMVQADSATISELRTAGPQNFTVVESPVGEPPTLTPLPAPQQNLTPVVIDNNDSTLEAILATLTTMNATMIRIEKLMSELAPTAPPAA